MIKIYYEILKEFYDFLKNKMEFGAFLKHCLGPFLYYKTNIETKLLLPGYII